MTQPPNHALTEDCIIFQMVMMAATGQLPSALNGHAAMANGKHVILDNESLRSSYNESVIHSPDANEYFGKWDSRSPSPNAMEQAPMPHKQ